MELQSTCSWEPLAQFMEPLNMGKNNKTLSPGPNIIILGEPVNHTQVISGEPMRTLKHYRQYSGTSDKGHLCIKDTLTHYNGNTFNL